MRATQLPPRAALLALGTGLAVVTSAIWVSPGGPGHPQPSQAVQADPLEAELAGAREAQAAAEAHLAQLRQQAALLETKLAGARAVPRPTVTVGAGATTHYRTVVVKTVVHDPACSDFRWQQDAQAAYLRDLTDPYGLDGPPGGRNDDGIACNQLPADPRRPASKPVAAYVEPVPVAPTKAQVLAQRKVRFGLYTTQSPYSFAEVNLVAGMLAKRPDTIGWFVGWDQPFRPDAIVDAWRHGTLPLMTWESHANGPGKGTMPDSDFALSRIIGGQYDSYIDSYAEGIKKLGMPVVIRLDHEMNGNWYPWSEAQPYNARGQYVQMWRHVVDRFRAVGADKDVIWLWAPSRVDDIGGGVSRYYPGDDYVDWAGMDGYFRGKSASATFADTFGRTLAALRALTHKPIYLAEIGATESLGLKEGWIQSLFQNLPLNPDIIGLSWFNIAVTSGSGSTMVTNDWRIDSSGPSILAFKAGIADARYSNMPAYEP